MEPVRVMALRCSRRSNVHNSSVYTPLSIMAAFRTLGAQGSDCQQYRVLYRRGQLKFCAYSDLKITTQRTKIMGFANNRDSVEQVGAKYSNMLVIFEHVNHLA